MSDAVAAAGWALAVNAGLVVWLALAAAGRRRELVARACHELRGPLTAASMALHAIARESPAAAGRAAAVDLELRRAALALEDLGQAATGRRHADRDGVVDVGALVARQAEVWRDVARADGCELSVRVEPGQAFVRGSELRLAQATGNLIANAIEHGRGNVELVVRDAGDRVRVEVCDSGSGLPAPVAELVHRRARRARQARARGLAIAAEIAERHGGRIAAAPGASRRPRGARAPGDGDLAVTRRRRAALLLGLALLLGGMAASDVAGRENAIKRAIGRPLAVVVTRTAVPAGARLTRARLAVRRVPARYAPAGSFRSPQALVGLRSAVALGPGVDLAPELVSDGTHSHPGPAMRPGERIAEIVARGSAQLIVPGGRVDVLVTREREGGAGATSLALRGRRGRRGGAGDGRCRRGRRRPARRGVAACHPAPGGLPRRRAVLRARAAGPRPRAGRPPPRRPGA